MRADGSGSPKNLKLYLNLSSFYFFYFALLGGLAPYWGLYLEDLGFNPIEIAQLTSILMITKVVAPNVWGWVGDHFGKRLELVRYGAFFTLIFFLAFYLDDSFWWYAFAMSLFSFFWNAVLPQFEVITLHSLGDQRERYSRVRLWGSVGFVVAVVLLGWLFDQLPISHLPDFLLAIIAAIWLCSLRPFDQPKLSLHKVRGQFVNALRNPQFISFLIFNFLLQLSHGPYYTFYSIYMQDLGYERTTIGLLWAVGVVAEVVLFIFMHRILQKVSLRQIVIVALSLTTIRWLMIGILADSLTLLFIAQLLHAASFGAMHAVAIDFVHSYFSSDNQGQGQAIYSSTSFGAGGAIGAILSGVAVSHFSSDAAFLAAALASFLALIVAFIGFKYNEHHS